MKQFALVLVVAAMAGVSFGQGFFGAPPKNSCAARSLALGKRSLPSVQTVSTKYFHPLKYSLFMDWRAPLTSMSIQFSGVNTMTFVLDSSAQEIRLDGAGIVIDGARVNGLAVQSTQPDASESFTVPLDNLHFRGDTIVVAIDYHRTNTDQVGFFLFDSNLYVGQSSYNDSVFTGARMAYTMSEPRDAHWWMPCLDDPSVKAKSEIRVLVPVGYSVSSNGLLKSEVSNPQGTLFTWVEDEPIATYLMCASASRFARWTDYYVRTGIQTPAGFTPGDSVPLMYFTWQVDSSSSDTTDHVYNAVHAFRNVARIMEGFSKVFGEYPFTKYGMTPAQPFGFGGMEHQTMTTINRVWLRGTSETGIAHEMMHQWFGDQVTCATWKDIWLNEGGATFGESIYNEFMFGQQGYANNVAQQMDNYLHQPNSFNQRIYDPEGQRLNVFNWATTYMKGGLVLHMLRRLLGDDRFFDAMRTYGNTFRFKSVTTAQFADVLSQFTGEDLHWFFNEWVFGYGHPKYDVRSVATKNWDGGLSGVSVTVTQRGVASGEPLFRMPVTFRVYSDLGDHDTTFVDSLPSQTFRIDNVWNSTIDAVTFDPENSILKDSTVETLDILGDVAETTVPGAPVRIEVAPSPIDDHASIRLSAALPVAGTLKIYDIIGREVSCFEYAPGEVVRWDTRSVTPGLYAVRSTSGSHRAVTTVQVVH